ncbi:alpha/beta hydrolase [Streptomyces sp. GMY02]|uniref:alpha/beta fold hydrolase n=1 Tax=Streptomyces sp. GMY02 TaxID=1333528 RepID=UPI001C2BE452|nr:alpha/beta hydrolase [Streptomyces sp. GMY02]QXE33622.1 alpha/beta hydrolase [Streptomyces sp. GMY02]
MSPTAALLRTALNTASYLAPGLAGRAALAVFRCPTGRARPRSDESEVMAAARTGRITVHGQSVVTYQWGDGTRPVLLVHGWSSRASRFARLATALREQGYSPVAFDAPGHGASEGRHTNIIELRAVIRQLHQEHGRFEAVVAHSFGVLATFFALRDGVEARRVVGIGGVTEFGHILDGFRAGLGVRERVVDELRRRIERTLFPGEPDLWPRFDATYRPEELDVAVLLFHDERDDMVPLGQSRALVRAYEGRPGGGARLVVTRGLGHRRIVADPEVVADAVEFIRAEQPATVSDAERLRTVSGAELPRTAPGAGQAAATPGAGQPANVPDGPVAGPRPGSALL